MDTTATLDGNTAVTHVAYRINDGCAIFPITPSSTMAELADEWSAQGEKNLWGAVPFVQEMQAEGGAAGAVHGALQAGALTTTFTASQGLLLMLPNMFKIAGELTACVFHVAARAIATQALSIFGDHSDIMVARTTGFALLSAGSVQEAHDLALVAQAATLEARVPFIHFTDGFRTSHEVNTLVMLSDEQIRAMIDDDLVRAHRQRALSPERPVTRGAAHNPDTFFQARETVNPYYLATPGIVQRAMDRFAALTGRQYHLFRYDGHPDAERVVVTMGSSAETLRATAAHLGAQGERVGVLQVNLYRPWSAKDFLAALPASVGRIAVLDRAKEPGAPAEPLCLDVAQTLADAVARGARGERRPEIPALDERRQSVVRAVELSERETEKIVGVREIARGLRVVRRLALRLLAQIGVLLEQVERALGIARILRLPPAVLVAEAEIAAALRILRRFLEERLADGEARGVGLLGLRRVVGAAEREMGFADLLLSRREVGPGLDVSALGEPLADGDAFFVVVESLGVPARASRRRPSG